jgi:hypothetical protein
MRSRRATGSAPPECSNDTSLELIVPAAVCGPFEMGQMPHIPRPPAGARWRS